MGCDIHIHAERKVNGQWQAIPDLHPFDNRSYGTFGFLAGVRNYSAVPPIAPPRDVPTDISTDVRKDYEGWDGDAHTPSWLSVAELVAFKYDQPLEDRRATVRVGPNAWNGGHTCEPGNGEMTTFREFLGTGFFDDLEKLKAAGAERVVFWFDN
jgi:hypothetical protein